jgi:hypothetical protein
MIGYNPQGVANVVSSPILNFRKDHKVYIYNPSFIPHSEMMYDNEMIDYTYHSLLISDCIA